MTSAGRKALAIAPTSPLLYALTDEMELASARTLRAASVVFIAVLTAAAAQVSVPLPFTPVPLTLQPMVVLLGGAVLGSRLGFASQMLYLAAGIVGLPVFAASPLLPPGAARLLGPTAGFLLSYPVAAFVAGWLAERGFDRRYLTSVASMAAGLVVVFASGILWLAFTLAPARPGASLALALQAGLYPFLALDIVKLFIAAAVLPGVWRFLGRSHFPPSTRKN
jgi:biotin transport system substrate-specific component